MCQLDRTQTQNSLLEFLISMALKVSKLTVLSSYVSIIQMKSCNSILTSTSSKWSRRNILERRLIGVILSLSRYFSELLVERQKLGPFMAVLPHCYQLLNQELKKSQQPQGGQLAFKILLAFSGLQHNLPKKQGYNTRVSECKEAARALLFSASGNGDMEPLLCNVDPSSFEAYKGILDVNLAKRAEHYFSESNATRRRKYKLNAVVEDESGSADFTILQKITQDHIHVPAH